MGHTKYQGVGVGMSESGVRSILGITTTSTQRLFIPFSNIAYHLYTVFLFTKNDILTAFIPGLLFTVTSAPLCNSFHLFPTIVWGWLHVLQFNLANQIKGTEEDKVNKPWRPLPAGRISLRSATIFRWLIAPLCLAYSSFYSTQLVLFSLQTQVFTFWYHDMDGDKNWLLKNVLPAFMYGCSELGGTLVAGCNPSQVSDTGKLAARLTVAVMASTVHCQDFKDVEGDRLIDRRSVPIVFPIASRLIAGFGLPIWSYVLSRIWNIDWLSTVAFVAYGCLVGGRFLFLRTRDADKLSCKYYSVWLALQHMLPGYWNYFHGSGRLQGGESLHDTWDTFSNASLLMGF